VDADVQATGSDPAGTGAGGSPVVGPRWRVVPSPVGALRVAAEGAHLRRIAFTDGDVPELPGPDAGSLEEAVLAEAARQLDEYFTAGRETFDLPIAPRGNEFRRRVWWALADVPYGTTVTYGMLADRLGLPGSARGVGTALGANPIVIVLPCHRVIGADGGLTGFGGGVARKEALLALEGSALL
jgi:methylated-DNA-[protein]-cysteine S-methyltransferase